MRTTLLALLALAGCGYPLDKFYEKKNQTYCELVITCGNAVGWESEDECIAALEEVQAADMEGCEETYDPQLGRACVKGLKKMTCDDLSAGTNYPEECVDACTSTDTAS